MQVGRMQDFRNLKVIPQVRILIRMVYQATTGFPRTEQFGLTAQMRKAAISIGSNIAEGCGRSSNSAYRVGLDRAMGEASELEFQCLVAQDLEFGKMEDIERILEQTIRVKKMLSSLIVSVRRRHPTDDDEGKIRDRTERPTSRPPKPMSRSPDVPTS
jgi:four helix bundle protein